MMRSLIFVSFLCLGTLGSCVSARSGCYRAGERMVGQTELAGVIDSTAGVNKFNLQVDIARNHFSGLLLVKQTGLRQFRTVFTTHFGMRVFDLEFIGDSLAVHYCVEPMQKEKTLRLFKHDFSFLFGWQGEENESVKIYKDKATRGEDTEVYRLGRHLFYRKNLKRGSVEKIVSGKGLGKTTWDFADFTASYPATIRIYHAFWPIKLELTRLSREQ